MKPIVIYATRSGNTEKVAKAIADELRCPCIRVKGSSAENVDLSSYDLVIVGTGTYKGYPSEDLVQYLNGLSLRGSRNFALFSTCFGWGRDICEKNRVDIIGGAVEAKGQKLLGDCFSCFGAGLGFVKRGHPDKSELEAAGKWAERIAKAF